MYHTTANVEATDFYTFCSAFSVKKMKSVKEKKVCHIDFGQMANMKNKCGSYSRITGN